MDTRLMIFAVILGMQCSALAQSPITSLRPRRGGASPNLGAAAQLPNQTDAPVGFDVVRAGIPRGNVNSFEYASKSSGETFRGTIYTPPGFAPTKKYSVLYLLHGVSGDETTWVQELHADAILDNLYADKKLMPMLVVMPSSLSVEARIKAGDSRDAKARASMAFGEVLLRDLISLVESSYPVQADREHRDLAGFSMGGGLAFSIGLTHPDQFAWVGAFFGVSTRRLGDNSRFDLRSPGRQLRLLWLSVGNRDNVTGSGVVAADAFLTERKVSHVLRINVGDHEPKVWKNDLYYFAMRLFQE